METSIAVVIGSRNPEGQTARAATAVAEGAAEAGAMCETVFLPELRIERCRQCDAQGWGDCSRKGQCVIADDLATVAEELRNADAVVFATPVYFASLSESLRAFLDRLRRTCCHQDAKTGINGKPVVGVCVAGGGGGGAQNCAREMELILHTCGFDVLDLVPVRRQNLELKVEVLNLTGRWLAEQAGAAGD